MIANTFAYFMLCCFVITLNIKTIESVDNSKVTPIKYYYPVYTEGYLRKLNFLRTFKDGPTILQTIEEEILSELCGYVTNDEEIRLEAESMDKLQMKIQDIQCSFCVITKSNILNLKKIVILLKTGEPFTQHKNSVKRFLMEANNILQILLKSNLKTDQWLWTYILKIVAIFQYDKNKPFIRVNLFEDDDFLPGFTNAFVNCITEEYLPPTAWGPDFLSKNTSNMYDFLSGTAFVTANITGRNLAAIELFLYLKPFWDDNELLFRQITEVDVDWSEIKQRFELEVAVTKEFVDNRTWIYTPNGRIEHQHLLVKIIDARIYCHLAVILHVYEEQLFMLEKQKLIRIQNDIEDVMLEALRITAHKDEFHVVISSEFMFGKIGDTDSITGISTRVLTKANGILNDLHGPSSNEINRISFNFDENQLFSIDLVSKIIQDFKDYLNEFERFLPFEYKVLLNFMGVLQDGRHLNRSSLSQLN